MCRTFSELQGGDPLVLVLSPGRSSVHRTGRQHEGLLQLHREMQVEFLRDVLQRCRPDWRIRTAAQRTRGRKVRKRTPTARKSTSAGVRPNRI